ncbi:hypothetical protein GCM10008932_15860 [Alkalibacterium iburiense]|uniref:SpoVT-AbrB domain-containing protein n=1 Tax=Alkalibacterium iburiense TaxID=290589 RepID=A0ABN0XHY6_9LACT
MNDKHIGKVIKHDSKYLLTIPDTIIKTLNLEDRDAVEFTIDERN